MAAAVEIGGDHPVVTSTALFEMQTNESEPPVDLKHTRRLVIACTAVLENANRQEVDAADMRQQLSLLLGATYLLLWHQVVRRRTSGGGGDVVSAEEARDYQLFSRVVKELNLLARVGETVQGSGPALPLVEGKFGEMLAEVKRREARE